MTALITINRLLGISTSEQQPNEYLNAERKILYERSRVPYFARDIILIVNEILIKLLFAAILLKYNTD